MPEVNIYEQTILMMDACNLSGLARSFSKEIVPAIREEVRSNGGGTQEVNTHPLAVLWTTKMASLAAGECLCFFCTEIFRRAYDEVKKRAGQGGTS